MLEHDDDDEDMNVSDNHDLGHIIRIVIILLLNKFFSRLTGTGSPPRMFSP